MVERRENDGEGEGKRDGEGGRERWREREIERDGVYVCYETVPRGDSASRRQLVDKNGG